ncbi:hypothetical protein BC939DRAFT_503136 [Gamsiella multidivaricata]|uniref:uncharacterized protein n=1 Tax=Gamsiella multidivaricata TaxID=101098 RepID=UPI0022208917|nr:uncharacterized protein BC939DRAFT_503136 [Gamsiella multidivaricata]KAG0365672.1 hypothetical protein BGZ54_006307 [Gamsiella multidivaricata]KAI7823564.1 hypothetical protein BC939DRAFT_503136 [Gamsiella multidivaricata]
MSISAAPRPLPPLTTSDPRSFYTIVVSGENFPLTMSAIQYDAPNFFSEIFTNPNRDESTTKMMYINRNPDVFRDIVKHMQGYYVAARDEVHLENLMMDAHFYKLNRLIENLRQTMFVNVSGTLFKVARETILNDSPNFFALLEPFADRNLTPTFFCRSPELFKDILSHLQGYEIHVRDKIHRSNLLKEARYFKLNNLVQKLSLGTEYIYSGFPTRPEDRIKPEVTMILKNIKVKHVIVKEWREFVKEASTARTHGIFSGNEGRPSNPISIGSGSNTSKADGQKGQDTTMADNSNKEKILQHNRALIQSAQLQDLLYKPTADIEPLALIVEISSIELFAIWPGSVNSSMLGDQHLLVYRGQDLICLNKICKQLGLQTLAMAANVVQLSPNIYFCLDGQPYKGQDELEPIIRKLALTSAKVTPPGRALRLFLGRALVKIGCKSGQIVMTIVKAEGWSSDKEYNACRKYLTEDKKDVSAL